MQPIVFFDGYCNLCSGSVQWIIKHDKKGQFKFASLQSDFAKQTLNKNTVESLSSLVLYQNNNTFLESTAALKIAKKLDFPVNLLSVFLIVPVFIRNFFYKIISRNRYKWFGKKQECWLPTAELKQRFIN